MVKFKNLSIYSNHSVLRQLNSHIESDTGQDEQNMHMLEPGHNGFYVTQNGNSGTVSNDWCKEAGSFFYFSSEEPVEVLLSNNGEGGDANG
jgi:hypothetical protein